MWPFRPKWKSKDPNKRRQAITHLIPRKHAHQKVLIGIARNDNNYSIRIAAVSKLTDRNLIADIAKYDDNCLVRHEAYKMLGLEDSQEALTDVAKNAPRGSHMQLQAVGKLTDKSVLAEIAKNDLCYDVRKVAYEKLGIEKSKEALIDIATHDYFENSRRDAVKEINDQNILADIAKKDKSSVVKKEALEKLNDPMIIAHIAIHEVDLDIQKAAVEKISDQGILLEIVRSTDNLSVRKAAVVKLTDQSVLAHIAKNGKDIGIRYAAIQKITDQNILIEMIRNSQNSDLQMAALKNLTDQIILSDIAKNDPNSELRKAALRNLNDQVVLGEIAMNDNELAIRITASLKLTDLSRKTENLIQIFLGDFNDRSEHYKSEIAEELKVLYQQDLLSVKDKAKILALKGQKVIRHADRSEYGDDWSGVHRDHSDTRFEDPFKV